ncbi:MAG: SpoIIIAH-like family protein [Oscillospiraceae bacterium]
MGMVIKRRQLVMATMVVALGAAVFVNWYFTKPNLQTGEAVKTGEVATQKSNTVNLGDSELVNGTTKAPANKNAKEYFAQSKLNRNTAHDKSLETLNSVIGNKNSSKSAVDAASAELTKLADTIKKEADIENLIKAKISGDCIVILNGTKAEVIVQKDTLNDNVIIQIKEIIINQCDITADNITIIEAK